jgi:hypothetical protein
VFSVGAMAPKAQGAWPLAIAMDMMSTIDFDATGSDDEGEATVRDDEGTQHSVEAPGRDDNGTLHQNEATGRDDEGTQHQARFAAPRTPTRRPTRWPIDLSRLIEEAVQQALGREAAAATTTRAHSSLSMPPAATPKGLSTIAKPPAATTMASVSSGTRTKHQGDATARDDEGTQHSVEATGRDYKGTKHQYEATGLDDEGSHDQPKWKAPRTPTRGPALYGLSTSAKPPAAPTMASSASTLEPPLYVWSRRGFTLCVRMCVFLKKRFENACYS